MTEQIVPTTVVRTSQIVWGVFLGMTAFSVVASIVFFAIHALLKATGDI